MTLGRRRREQQESFWVAADRLGNGPRNAFYDRLNQLLAEIEFDRKLEEAADPFYEKTRRRSLPPGVYFRMIFIGYFEDISSQRGITWRCEDSRSLARFLGYSVSVSQVVLAAARTVANLQFRTSNTLQPVCAFGLLCPHGERVHALPRELAQKSPECCD